MALSPQGTTAAQDTASDVVWCFLMTLTTPGNPPLRVCNNNERITSRGEHYDPYPFEVRLASDTGETLPRVEVNLLSLAPEMIEAVRGFAEPPGVHIELVSSLDWDVVERDVDNVVLRGVTYDALGLSAQLDVVNVLSAPFPSESYTPALFPGLFA
jgi:hypothetical protein